MAVLVMDMSGWAKRWKGRQSQFKAAQKSGLVAAGMRSIPLLQRSARDAPPANPSGEGGEGGAVNTGNYVGRFVTRNIPNGISLTNDASYSGVIEGGRRAGARRPPLGVIQRWAMRKMGLSEEDAKQAAFPIASAIARRGLAARKVMGSVLDQIGTFAREELGKAMTRLFEGGK